jgi:hypothetical protein
MISNSTQIIQHENFWSKLANRTAPSRGQVGEILSKAKCLKGINGDETLALLNIEDEGLLQELFEAAKFVEETAQSVATE